MRRSGPERSRRFAQSLDSGDATPFTIAAIQSSGRGGIPGQDQLRPEAALATTKGDSSLISNEKLTELYTTLLTCRRMAGEQETNGASRSLRGQEASLVAATIDLGPGDAVCAQEHGVLTGFSKGALIANALLRNGKHPLPSAKEAQAAPANGSSPTAARLDYTHAALGTALAHKTRTSRKVTVVFSSKATSEELREAVHIATVHSLPMVFVHQVDGEKPGRKPQSSKKKNLAKTPWFPHITVDRDDVVAAYRVASEAIARARLGRGPTLIECRPFPSNGTLNGNGDHSHDPVRNMEHYLRAKGLFDPGLKDELLKQFIRGE